MVGAAYELGTESYRAKVLKSLVREHVPTRSRILLSDDPSVWRAGSDLAGDYSVIGVLHADDDHYYNLAERYGSTFAALVCVSSRVHDRLIQRRRVPADRVFRIPCGIPIPSPRLHSNGAKRPRLIWVGRIEESQKRVSDLPRILHALRTSGVSATLDIVGDGPDLAALRRAFDEPELREAVSWRGWCDAPTVHSLMARSDILILPSNFEGMPIAVMEALAMGCGVVATRVSGVEDYARHAYAKACYRTFTIGDIDAATLGVMDLLRVPAATRASDARRLAEAEFAIERCVRRYRSVPACPCPVQRFRAARRWQLPFAAFAAFPLALARSMRFRIDQYRRTLTREA
jgi:glycosyltransferase involved in cell wall biosynthesis